MDQELYMSMLQAASGIVESFHGDLLCDRRFMIEKLIEENEHVAKDREYLFSHGGAEEIRPVEFVWTVRRTGTHITTGNRHATMGEGYNSLEYLIEDSSLVARIVVDSLSNKPDYPGTMPRGTMEILKFPEVFRMWEYTRKHNREVEKRSIEERAATRRQHNALCFKAFCGRLEDAENAMAVAV